MTLIDDVLDPLTPAELGALHERLVDAICDQPPFDSPTFDVLLAYELSLLNQEVIDAAFHTVHLFDEWWVMQMPDDLMAIEPPF